MKFHNSCGKNHRCGVPPLLVLITTLIVLLIIMRHTVYQNSPISNITRPKPVGALKDDQDVNCNFNNYIFGQLINQTDPCLVAAVRNTMMIPPPPYDKVNRDPIKITKEIPSNIEKFNWIKKLLVDNQNPAQGTPGFFIECGANDGLYISSTLNIEKSLNWTGLLIEAIPKDFETLLTRKRNVWAINAAACITKYPMKTDFYVLPKQTGRSGMKDLDKKRWSTVKITVQCIPLYTMLAALNVRTVDFLNLDVEGMELAILETIPFDKITFKVMSIEYAHIPGQQKALQEFLEPKGYRFVKEIQDIHTYDSLYVHESLYELAKSLHI